MSSEANLLPYEAYADVQPPSPLFFHSDDEEDAGEENDGEMASQHDTNSVCAETDQFLDRLGSPKQYRPDNIEVPADGIPTSRHLPGSENTKDGDEDHEESSESVYSEDAQSQTGFHDYVTSGMRTSDMFVPLAPMSPEAFEQRYYERHGDISHDDIKLGMDIMGPSMMDLVAEIVRRMRQQGQVIFRGQYKPLSKRAFQEFVDDLTQEALPYVKQRVDRQYDERLVEALEIVKKEAKRYKASKKDKIKQDLDDFRKREEAQAIEHVKAYRSARFADAQALAEQNENEAYEQLDTEVAETRVRRETKLAQDMKKEKQRQKANMMAIMKREVQDEKTVEMAKMRADLKQEKAEKMDKIESQVAEEMAERLVEMEGEVTQAKAERMAEMKREVAREKARMLADLKTRNEEQLDALASKKGASPEAASPSYSPSASVLNDEDVQEDSLEGNTLVDSTPNKESQANDGSAPRGKKRSRSPSRAQETDLSDALDKPVAAENAQGDQEPSEEDPAPSPKRQRMLEISELCSEGESKSSNATPYYTRGTESVLGSLNNMQAPENPAMPQADGLEKYSISSQKATDSNNIEGMKATSSAAQHDNNAVEANTAADTLTNHASATSADKQTDGAEANKKKSKYIFGMTNVPKGGFL